jgi:hypothetical protein
MLFISDMPRKTQKNGALRALFVICLKMSQYSAFWPGFWLLAWLATSDLRSPISQLTAAPVVCCCLLSVVVCCLLSAASSSTQHPA